MDSDNFILFGGIPRSGTTLTCHLFNQQPNSHALVESMDISALLKLDTEIERASFINNYLTDIYSKIKAQKPILINIIEKQDTNTFSETKQGSQEKRKNKIVKKQPTLITQPLNDEFKLILKHPNAFIALLPELKERFSIFAQIRNPLSILASWNSIAHPLNKGHAPMAEAANAPLKQRLATIKDDLDRQITLLDWYYTVIDNNLPAHRIIKYEDIVNTNGEILSQIVAQDYASKKGIESRNNNSIYNQDYLQDACSRLLSFSAHACWRFYCAGDVE